MNVKEAGEEVCAKACQVVKLFFECSVVKSPLWIQFDNTWPMRDMNCRLPFWSFVFLQSCISFLRQIVTRRAVTLFSVQMKSGKKSRFMGKILFLFLVVCLAPVTNSFGSSSIEPCTSQHESIELKELARPSFELFGRGTAQTWEGLKFEAAIDKSGSGVSRSRFGWCMNSSELWA